MEIYHTISQPLVFHDRVSNDWAAGTSVLLMTFGKVAADFAEPQFSARVPDSFWWLIGVILASFLSIEHDRFRSWRRDASGKIENKKRLFIGIILPNLVSGIIFASYQLRKALGL